jgi:hypothetical protein
MFLRCVVLYVFSCAVVFGSWFARDSGSTVLAAQAGDAKVTAADQEVLKMNEECNAAELRGDVAAMNKCETDDFTHTHSTGIVEHKAEYLEGVRSGAHKFLTLDLSDVHVRSYGAAAIVEGHMHHRANNNFSTKISDLNFVFMTFWVKQQGEWREAAWIVVPRSDRPSPDVRLQN